MTPFEVRSADAFADALIVVREWNTRQTLDHGMELAEAATRQIYPPTWDNDWPSIVAAHNEPIDKRIWTGLVALRLLDRASKL